MSKKLLICIISLQAFRMNRSFLAIFLAILFVHCSSEKKGERILAIERNNAIINIDLDSEEKYDILYTSSLFKKVDVIILETTEASLLSSIDKIEIVDDLLLILDSKAANGVFVFDRTGNFMKRMGQTGGGPGEYTHCSDFTIDPVNHILYILDRKTQRINTYSFPGGEYTGTVKIQNANIRSEYILYYNGKLYADAESHVETNNDFLLREIDLKTGEQTGCWLSNQQYNKGYNNRLGNNTYFIPENPFYTSPCSEPKYIQIFMDTIVSITPTGILPFLTIESKDLLSPQDVQFAKRNQGVSVVENLVNVDRIYNLHNYMEGKDFLYFSYIQGPRLKTILYNKKDGAAKKIAGILDDMVFKINLDKQEFGIAPRFKYSDQQGLYGCISLNYIENLIDLLNADKLNAGITQKIHEANITEDSNPVILYYQYE